MHVTKQQLMALPAEVQRQFMDALTPVQHAALKYDWEFNARPNQLMPEGDHWDNWLALAGRGFGKTRTGSEFVRTLIKRGYTRIALIGDTAADVRDTMINGESGILAVHPKHERPSYSPSTRSLKWPNGAIGHCLSAEDPESIRGLQFMAGYIDELAKYRYADSVWSNYQFALRLGKRPLTFIATTPKPIAVLKAIMKNPRTVITRGSSYDNLSNLAPTFLMQLQSYQGTRLGRQEIDGELLEDSKFALWSRDMFMRYQGYNLDQFVKIVVAVDPPAGSKRTSDSCGIMVIGQMEVDDPKLGPTHHYYLLKDLTVQGVKPEVWASVAVNAYHEFSANFLVAEVNNGGDMVESVIRAIDTNVPVQKVHATRGKYIRAEPVAAMYEQRRVFHPMYAQELEDQMCLFEPQGMPDGSSPDRLDALVWGITSLDPKKSPRLKAATV